MAVAILIVYLQSQLQSNDALFLFISSSLWVNILLVALASTLVWLTFQNSFKSVRTYLAASLAAIVLSILGLVGLLSAGLDKYLFDVIKPLDYALLLEAGVVFGICSLSYQHPKVSLSLPLLNLTRLRQLSSGLPIPQLSGNSHGSRPRAA